VKLRIDYELRLKAGEQEHTGHTFLCAIDPIQRSGSEKRELGAARCLL
jgi:hypothetical protein